MLLLWSGFSKLLILLLLFISKFQNAFLTIHTVFKLKSTAAALSGAKAAAAAELLKLPNADRVFRLG